MADNQDKDAIQDELDDTTPDDDFDDSNFFDADGDPDAEPEDSEGDDGDAGDEGSPDEGDDADAGDDDDAGDVVEDDPEPKAKDPDKVNPEKKIEQLNYTVTNLQRKQEAITERIDKLLTRIEQQGGQPTDAQRQELADLQDDQQDQQEKIEGLIEDIDLPEGDYEFISGSQAKKLLENQRRIARALEEDRKSRRQQQQQQQADAAERDFWSGFDAKYPDAAGKGPELWDQAIERARQMDHVKTTDELRGAALTILHQLATESTKPTPPAKPAPPSKKPAKSTEGTKFTDGAPARTPKPSADDPDDDLMTDDMFITR